MSGVEIPRLNPRAGSRFGIPEGIPARYAEAYGKPCVGAHYERDDVAATAFDEPWQACCVCGRKAGARHHFPPKGMGGGGRALDLRTEWGIFVLKPALFAVCGTGNESGCHGKMHRNGGVLTPEWVWDDPVAAAEFWSGWAFAHGMRPHSEELYLGGHWEVRDGEGRLVAAYGMDGRMA